MAAISETLRQARLRSGIDLDRLAEKTKINPRYLQAIEAGDFAKLPSGIFARMFVKQYADAVGLDGASFAEEFQRSTSYGHDSGSDIQSIAATRHNYQPSVPGLSSVGDRVRGERLAGMVSSFIWVVAVILVCAGAYYGLAHLPSRSMASTSSPEPKPPARPVVTPAPAAAPSTSTSVSGTQADANNAAPAGSPETPAPTATAPPVPAPSGAIQLAISVSEPVWVTAVADGKTVVSEVVNPGASKTVSANTAARVTLGNAGGAEITFNGKKMEPFGPKGQVRTIEFTSQGAQVISRTSPKPAEPPANPDPLR
jgi:cytoskeleton protein RodZ